MEPRWARRLRWIAGLTALVATASIAVKLARVRPESPLRRLAANPVGAPATPPRPDSLGMVVVPRTPIYADPKAQSSSARPGAAAGAWEPEEPPPQAGEAAYDPPAYDPASRVPDGARAGPGPDRRAGGGSAGTLAAFVQSRPPQVSGVATPPGGEAAVPGEPRERRGRGRGGPAGGRPAPATAVEEAAPPPGVPAGDAAGSTGADVPETPKEPPTAPPQEQAPGQPETGGRGTGPSLDPRFGREERERDAPPKLYRVGAEGATEWTEARPLDPTLAELGRRLPATDTFRIRIQGETAFGDPLARDAALAHLRWRLSTRYVGDVVEIDRRGPFDAKGRAVLVRIVRKDAKPALPAKPKPPTPAQPPKPADTVGTDRIDALHSAVWRAFPDLESWGICNCRRISGSSSWSQHAWCNAEDLHRKLPSRGYKESMDPVAAWLRANKARYGIQYIIWRRDPKCDDMTNDHCNHIHVDMQPTRSGTPPCAR